MIAAKLLVDMTLPELIDAHNRLSSRMLVIADRVILRTWRGTREELIGRIETMRPATRARTVARKPRRAGKMRHLGVGKFCVALVCRVVGRTSDGCPVGLSYGRMLQLAQKKFPMSAVDEKHLRWYAAKARRDGLDVPAWRGRSHWTTPAEEYKRIIKKEAK